MTTTRSVLALGAAGVLLLSGCGGSGGSTSAGVAQAGSGGSAGEGSSASSAATGADPTKVDVCSLLNQDDANAVARARGLNGAQTDAATYTLTATPKDEGGTPPSSSCVFHFDGDGAQATVEVQVQSAEDFSLYKDTGKAVPGLGDEAYKGQGSTVVRVGGLMMSAGENSATDEFVVEMYKKMIPKLRQSA